MAIRKFELRLETPTPDLKSRQNREAQEYGDFAILDPPGGATVEYKMVVLSLNV